MMQSLGRPIVLADRDGTLIHEVPYLSRLEDIRLLPGVAEALRKLNIRGIPVAVVTNQSGVARGLFSESFILESHARLMALLSREGASLQGLYYCPHLNPERLRSPPDGASLFHIRSCFCRKPEPGLLLRALKDLQGNPMKSVMIGDADRDILAGNLAGCGHGYRIIRKEEEETEVSQDRQVRSFSEAVDRFLSLLDSEIS